MPEITVHGEPVAKERPRRGAKGQWYTPRATKDYESLVGWTWKQARLDKFSGPVDVCVDFWIGGRDKDLDNLVKCVLDGLNGIAWDDDGQIAHIEACKYRSTKVVGPRAVIRVLRLA